ncbi:hypothetical protein SLS55_008368 [Diplodia seriata]|uniref:Uncharacterized protein n=1 Tax=Diplodia seriata TaxID=420778 RepID=A0ABR3CAL0_9PEZI
MSDPASSAMKPRTKRRADGPQAAVRNTATLHDNIQEPSKMRTKRRADDLDAARDTVHDDMQEPPRKTIKRRADATDATHDILYDKMQEKIETGDLNPSKKRGPPCDIKDEIAEEPLRKKCKKEEYHPSDAPVSPQRSTTAANEEEVCNQCKKVEIPPTADSLLNKTPQQNIDVQHGNTANERVTPPGNMADDAIPNPSRKRSRSPSPSPADGRISKNDDAMPKPPKKRLRPTITVKNISNSRTPIPKTTSKKHGEVHESGHPAAAAAARNIFRWADLPGELKNLIYKHALTTPAPIDAHKRISLFDKPPTLNLVPALLLLNKQTYAEAAPILYGENKFVFTSELKLRAWLRRVERPPAVQPQPAPKKLSKNELAAAHQDLLRSKWLYDRYPPPDGAQTAAARSAENPWGQVECGPHPPATTTTAPPLALLRHLTLHRAAPRSDWIGTSGPAILQIYHTLRTRAPRLETFDVVAPDVGRFAAICPPAAACCMSQWFVRVGGSYVAMMRWLIEVGLGTDVATGEPEICIARMAEVLGREPGSSDRRANDGGDDGPLVPSLPNDVWGRHFWAFLQSVRKMRGTLPRGIKTDELKEARKLKKAERMETAEGREEEIRRKQKRMERRQREMDRLDDYPHLT